MLKNTILEKPFAIKKPFNNKNSNKLVNFVNFAIREANNLNVADFKCFLL